jgi:hypothetical protein
MMIENFVNPSERHVLEDLKQARGLPRRFCSDNVPRFLEPRRRSAVHTYIRSLPWFGRKAAKVQKIWGYILPYFAAVSGKTYLDEVRGEDLLG